MIDHVCRWCGEGAPANHDLPHDAITKAHEFCMPALVLQCSVTTPEGLLESASRREAARLPG